MGCGLFSFLGWEVSLLNYRPIAALLFATSFPMLFAGLTHLDGNTSQIHRITLTHCVGIPNMLQQFEA